MRSIFLAAAAVVGVSLCSPAHAATYIRFEFELSYIIQLYDRGANYVANQPYLERATFLVEKGATDDFRGFSSASVNGTALRLTGSFPPPESRSFVFTLDQPATNGFQAFNPASLTLVSASGYYQGYRLTSPIVPTFFAVSAISEVERDPGSVTVSNFFTFTRSAVPEPASWAMMIAGFGVVGAALRRRMARTTAHA